MKISKQPANRKSNKDKRTIRVFYPKIFTTPQTDLNEQH